MARGIFGTPLATLMLVTEACSSSFALDKMQADVESLPSGPSPSSRTFFPIDFSLRWLPHPNARRLPVTKRDAAPAEDSDCDLASD